MDTFRTAIEIAAFSRSGERVRMDSVIVDPDVMFAWLPSELLANAGIEPVETEQFERKADGRIIERLIGHALITAAGEWAPTLVVFAEPGDRIVLGAHALAGMNLRLDLVEKRLVPAGPVSAAAA